MTRSLLPSLFGNDKTTKAPFQVLQDEIDRVFDDFRKPLALFDRDKTADANGWLMPKIDVSENEDAVEVVAEIPGVKEDNIDVTVTNNVLVIKGEKSEEHKEEKKDYHLVERSHGSYMRSVPLGFDVDSDEVKATFDAGILTVTVKKPAEIKAKTKKIELTRAV